MSYIFAKIWPYWRECFKETDINLRDNQSCQFEINSTLRKDNFIIFKDKLILEFKDVFEPNISQSVRNKEVH